MCHNCKIDLFRISCVGYTKICWICWIRLPDEPPIIVTRNYPAATMWSLDQRLIQPTRNNSKSIMQTDKFHLLFKKKYTINLFPQKNISSSTAIIYMIILITYGIPLLMITFYILKTVFTQCILFDELQSCFNASLK